MSSILTVSQLNRYVSSKFRDDTKFRGIAVKGEISNLSVHYKTGHIYFSLIDKDSVLKAVLFSQNASRIKFSLNNGISVVAMGNIVVYESGGVYQINVTELIPQGVGAEKINLDALKNKLSKLGVFDLNAKKIISKSPKKIAVVTSHSGAALQDILNIIERRYPICKVVVCPANVQGITAPSSIASAIKNADNSGADTIILARGGGSSEDLSAFNDENVVMSVFNCLTPVISAIGHETDTSLTDYAADLRAPTPSAAAELAVPNMSIYISDINVKLARVKTLILNRLDKNMQMVELLTTRASNMSPIVKLEKNISEIEKVQTKLNYLMYNKINRLDSTLTTSVAKLNAISPFNVLDRGYSIVVSGTSVIKSVEGLEIDQDVEIKFKKGTALAKITQINND
ncbi:MAG: exodeoxyribonuclease VII large subunit [Clostridiales bacterium]|nr:exodeoxyribonuclease VII large subunit [Clostridiales bacterium]